MALLTCPLLWLLLGLLARSLFCPLRLSAGGLGLTCTLLPLTPDSLLVSLPRHGLRRQLCLKNVQFLTPGQTWGSIYELSSLQGAQQTLSRHIQS